MSRDSSGGGMRPGTTGGLLEGARQALEQLRHPERRDAVLPTQHPDVRAEVLAVLAEGPGTGYDVVRALAQRDGGDAPGAGAVYPTLQLLADEGLTTASDDDGRKRYTLTDAGRTAAEVSRARAEREDEPARTAPARRGALTKASAQLAQVVALVAQTGTAEQVGDAAAVLDDARQRLLAILARR
jgi:DNA-binding PadR family transcriptional regulator